MPTSRNYLAKTISLALILFWLVGFNFAVAQTSQPITTSNSHVKAKLLINQGNSPEQLWLGILLEHQPNWHTYWRNPGEIGEATKIQLTLPAGVSAGEVHWPTPISFSYLNIKSYGYSDKVILPIPLTINARAQKDGLIKAKINWLACENTCIPGQADLQIQLNSSIQQANLANLFDLTLANLPHPVTTSADNIFYIQTNAQAQQQLIIQTSQLPTPKATKFNIFSANHDLIDETSDWQQQWLTEKRWQASINLEPERLNNISFTVLQFYLQDINSQQSYLLTVNRQGAWKISKTSQPTAKVLSAPNLVSSEPAASHNLGLILIFAALGGLLLNLMPCVFPILAIKALSFLHPNIDKQQLKIEGLAYLAGCLIGFISLASIILILRQLGSAVGWGFQLQSPITINLLIVLLTVIGLNLAGLFEFSSILPTKIASKNFTNPSCNSFFTGVLSVIIATPCTAPFMGAATGASLFLPAYQVVLIFAVMAVAMASPLVLFSFLPQAASWLPKPGQWMLTFKQLMAFPMFATIIWLLWVLGVQVDHNAVINNLIFLLLLTLLLWCLKLKGKVKVICLSLTLTTLIYSGYCSLTTLNTSASVNSTSQLETPWQPWSAELEQQLLAEGKSLFIDYTAAWCITCQYNKKTVLTDAQVLRAFKAKSIELLVADWTNYNAQITQSLANYGRNGVPTYVLLKPAGAPIVLKELLFKNSLLALIEQQ